MAEEKITFKIGSQLTGDGFNKADSAVKGIAQTSGKARSAINLAVGEFQKMDGELGKLAGSAGNVIQSFAQFGMIGGVIAGVQVGVQALAKEIEGINDELLSLVQHSNDFSDRLKKISDNATIKHMKDAMKDATTEAQRAMQAVKDTNAAINALAGAKGEGAVAQANERIAQLMKEKAEAVASALGEFQKQVASAQGDLKIAQYELEEAHRSAAASVKKAGQDVEQAQQEQVQAIENLVAAQRAVEIAENDYKKAKIHGAVSMEEYERTLEQARTAEKNAMAAKAKADNAVVVALEKQETAETNMRTAITKAETKVIEMTAARDKAKKALDESTAKEESYGMTTKEFEQFKKKELERAKKEANEIRRLYDQRNKALEENIKALEEEKDALKKWSKTVDKANDAYNTKHGWMGGDTTWERTESGGLKNFGDYQKAERWADRAERDKVENSMYFKGNEKRAADLQARLDSGKKLTQEEQGWLDKWSGYKKQLRNEDDIDAQIKAWRDKIKDNTEEMKDILDSIDKSLENQGLK